MALGYLTTSGKPGRGANYQVSLRSMANAPKPADVLALRLRTNGSIQNADYREVFGASRAEAKAALSDLVERGVLLRSGERRGTRYSAGPGLNAWSPPAKEP